MKKLHALVKYTEHVVKKGMIIIHCYFCIRARCCLVHRDVIQCSEYEAKGCLLQSCHCVVTNVSVVYCFYSMDFINSSVVRLRT